MAKAVNTQIEGGRDARTAVDKALDVLNALVRPDAPHRLAEIARQTGLAKATVHRTLQNLTDAGFAVSTEGGSYQAGPRLLGMSAAALAGSRESRFARPILVELQRQTGHTVHYAVRHGDVAVYVDKVEQEQAYRMNSRVGGEVPLYCTAAGRAILSRLPATEVGEVLGGQALPARTARTLTDPADILATLSEVDELGYVVETEQNEPDVRCVAAPVVDGRGEAVGAISVSGLTFTLREESVPVLGPLVRDAAAKLSAALGGGGLRSVPNP